MPVMARETWTDARLDDLKGQMNQRFDQVDARFGRIEADVRELRKTLNQGIGIMVIGFLSLGGLILTLGGIVVL